MNKKPYWDPRRSEEENLKCRRFMNQCKSTQGIQFQDEVEN